MISTYGSWSAIDVSNFNYTHLIKWFYLVIRAQSPYTTELTQLPSKESSDDWNLHLENELPKILDVQPAYN